MIKLYLDVSAIVHMNKHTKYPNYGLYVNFSNFLLMSFCFMMKKEHLTQKLLLWPRVPFKEILELTIATNFDDLLSQKQE